MAAELTPGKGGEEAILSSISNEQQILQGEKAFFGRLRYSFNFSGIYVIGDVPSVSAFYSFIHVNLAEFYPVLAKDLRKPIEVAQDAFFSRYLSAEHSRGNLVTDEKAKEVLEDIRKGNYSQQVSAFQRETSRRDEDEGWQEEKGGDKKYKSFGYLAVQKGRILSALFDLDAWLKQTYGEVNYKSALLLEFLFDAPFAGYIQSKESSEIDPEMRKRHKEYIDRVVAIVKEFDLSGRIDALEQNTADIKAAVHEESSHIVSDFDREYLMKVYDLSGRLQTGKEIQDPELEELYDLLRATVFRRRKFFRAVDKGPYDVVIAAADVDKASFADIAGYQEQTAYLKNLTERVGEKDPRIRDIRLVLLVSNPGMGKSLSINAFLNSLPENARAVIVNHRNVNIQGLLKRVGQFAAYDSGLEIFLVLEDVDANSDLLKSLLNIQSVVPKEIPANVHLIATTNYPDSMQRGILRPGRASEILFYGPPKKAERAGILKVHLTKTGISLSDEMLSYITSQTGGFTPDEIAHIARELAFAKITKPTKSNVERIIGKIKRRRAVQKISSQK